MKIETDFSVDSVLDNVTAIQTVTTDCPVCKNHVKFAVSKGVVDYEAAYKDLEKRHRILYKTIIIKNTNRIHGILTEQEQAILNEYRKLLYDTEEKATEEFKVVQAYRRLVGDD